MAQDDPKDRAESVRRLLERLSAQTETPIPTSALGRLRRTASTALRAGTGMVAGRLLGSSGVEQQAIERVVLSLGELKGVAMKMGQILSYMDTSLPSEARRQLAVLQRRSQPTGFAWIEAALRQDFGERAEVLLRELGREPVATASIGQVHQARLADGTLVAVKVRHPGIEEAIRADFRGARTGKALARMLAPGTDIQELIAEAEARFLEECDYTRERAHQQRFIEVYSAHPSIGIPTVYAEWSSARVLTSRWCEGERLEDFASRAGEAERKRASLALHEFYVGSLYRHGLFNADPHPGNLLFQRDGRVVVLDHGCVRAFDQPTVRALARLSGAVRADDATEIQEALRELGAKSPEPGPGFEATRGLLRGFFGPALVAGPHRIEAAMSLEAREVLQNKRKLLRLQLPGKLLFLFRIRFGLHSVLAHLGAELDWGQLEAEAASVAMSP